jgi:hypothetical protein
MNTFGIFPSAQIVGIRHFTHHLRQHFTFTKKTQINETHRYKIDEEVKSFERLLYLRLIYIFASLCIKISV